MLEADDLAVTHACLKAWEGNPGNANQLFAFFNSGDHSGASQAHRHLQFLPVEEMDQGPKSGWQPLINLMMEMSDASTKGMCYLSI